MSVVTVTLTDRMRLKLIPFSDHSLNTSILVAIVPNLMYTGMVALRETEFTLSGTVRTW